MLWSMSRLPDIAVSQNDTQKAGGGDEAQDFQDQYVSICSMRCCAGGTGGDAEHVHLVFSSIPGVNSADMLCRKRDWW